MGILTEDMKRLVGTQRLGFVATVSADGTPNLSPKGTTLVWDDDHLIFADIRSPGTVSNLRRNTAVEINVVDPIVRKGYRFKGTGEILETGRRLEEAIAFYRRQGMKSPIRRVVLVRVKRALPLISPAYDGGATEEAIRAQWERYWHSVRAGEAPPPASD